MFLGKSEGTAGPEINKIRTPEKKPVESKQVGLPCSLLIFLFFLDAVLLIFFEKRGCQSLSDFLILLFFSN